MHLRAAFLGQSEESTKKSLTATLLMLYLTQMLRRKKKVLALHIHEWGSNAIQCKVVLGFAKLFNEYGN